MLLSRSGEIEDGWTCIDEACTIPWHGPIIVPLSRLDETLAVRAATGVAIPNDAEIDELRGHYPRIGLISITFPNFADGRGFSIARRLRETGFQGRLRADGPIIADQFAFLLDCGFDEVAVPASVAERQPVEQWMAQLGRISLGYQRGRITGSILDRRSPDPA